MHAYTHRGVGRTPTASQHNIFDLEKTHNFFLCSWISSPTLYQLSHHITPIIINNKKQNYYKCSDNSFGALHKKCSKHTVTFSHRQFDFTVYVENEDTQSDTQNTPGWNNIQEDSTEVRKTHTKTGRNKQKGEWRRRRRRRKITHAKD